MFRKITISLALAAITTIGIATAAPALAAPPTGGSISTTEVGDSVDAITGGLVDATDAILEAPECSVEIEDGWVPCIDLGSLSGLPAGDESETDGPLTPGGVVTDAPVDVVEPEDVLIDPALLPDISDIIDFPGLPESSDSGDSESDAPVVIVERPDPGDLFDEIYGTDRLDGLVEEPADGGTTSESDDATLPAGTPAPAAEEESAAEGERAVEDHAIDTTTTTAPVVEDEIDGDQPVVAAIDLTTPVDPEEGFNPLLGALFGALAALTLAGAGFAAFKFGRRGV